MITVEDESFYSVIKAAYYAIDKAPLSADPDIYREDTALLSLSSGYEDAGLIDNTAAWSCVFDRQKYFPGHNSLKVAAEDKYWNEKLVETGFIEKVVNHLRQNPSSRSCLYSFWDNTDFDIANPKGSCITQVYFRVRGKELEMHSHVRANDVHRCLFMDLAYLTFAHQLVAERSGYRKGRYVQFVDSLHIYKKSVDEFKGQLLYLKKSSEVWG